MAEVFGTVLGLFGGGGAAAAGGAAAGGFSLSTILQGGLGVLGLVSSISAGNAEATEMELAAMDADSEQALENLKGIDRRRSLKLAAADAIGEMDVAYAASGVDLSFGTAAQARNEALREADLGLTSEATTTMGRLSRLQERASSYRRMAKQKRRAGWISGLTGALGNFAQIRDRY